MKNKNIKSFGEFNENLNISDVRSSKINESNNKTYKWFIKTKDFDKIPFFYSNTTNNPMNEIEGFDRGSHWCIDFGSNIEVAEFYQIDPDDDSFVLIPKDEVIDIWCEETSNPKSIRKY